MLFVSGKASPINDFSIHIENSVVQNCCVWLKLILGVTLDYQMSFAATMAATICSSRFMLHNFRRIRPFLTQKATQVLVQASVISGLDYCNSLLSGLPFNFCSSSRMQQPSWSSAYPSPPTLHRSSAPFPGSSWNTIDTVTGTYQPCCERLRPSLHPEHGQRKHPSPSTMQKASYSLTTRVLELPLNKIQFKSGYWPMT